MQGAWLRGGHLVGRKKTKAQWQVSVQEVGLYILVTGQRNEASGQQCRGHRKNKNKLIENKLTNKDDNLMMAKGEWVCRTGRKGL